ncbi:MAG TPA: tRNA (adenosine(37)-N6)-threonylcarbamoyltransferase complex transferase subunit TsaD [Chthoniobacteraceae bacterium]|nr:tRNA (adenosine(37)-N6)-threonylcarbamoyltransferase complex transferase subunit TsaD [Chthoniobacteraceae bacterium]
MTSAASVLAIETSCDETAVAILRGDRLLASQVASQIALHREYGGVVPEVASRNHLRVIREVIESAVKSAAVRIEEIDAFAATRGPGLATSLMIGMSVAKGLAIGFNKPFLSVNHLEGHLLSPFFGQNRSIENALGLVVSGGHTLLVDIEGSGSYRLLGRTRDDAAGEAFDKVGKLLGLPYPGGPNVDRVARDGDPTKYAFPRSMLDSGDLNFSFSGLKTAVRYFLPKLAEMPIADVCASFQEAVVDVLVEKSLRAAEETGRRTIAVSGGVSCNSRLRTKLAGACVARGVELLLAEPWLCTDNAAMIGFAAAEQLARGEASSLAEDIDPNLQL